MTDDFQNFDPDDGDPNPDDPQRSPLLRVLSIVLSIAGAVVVIFFAMLLFLVAMCAINPPYR
jgi:disulfide bond formation protein DsbB